MSSMKTPADLGDVPMPVPEPKFMTPAAQRALAEAAERRARAEAEIKAQASEDGGPSGPEPTRFGDWERKGIAVDF